MYSISLLCFECFLVISFWTLSKADMPPMSYGFTNYDKVYPDFQYDVRQQKSNSHNTQQNNFNTGYTQTNHNSNQNSYQHYGNKVNPTLNPIPHTSQTSSHGYVNGVTQNFGAEAPNHQFEQFRKPRGQSYAAAIPPNTPAYGDGVSYSPTDGRQPFAEYRSPGSIQQNEVTFQPTTKPTVYMPPKEFIPYDQPPAAPIPTRPQSNPVTEYNKLPVYFTKSTKADNSASSSVFSGLLSAFKTMEEVFSPAPKPQEEKPSIGDLFSKLTQSYAQLAVSASQMLPRLPKSITPLKFDIPTTQATPVGGLLTAFHAMKTAFLPPKPQESTPLSFLLPPSSHATAQGYQQAQSAFSENTHPPQNPVQPDTDSANQNPKTELQPPAKTRNRRIPRKRNPMHQQLNDANAYAHSKPEYTDADPNKSRNRVESSNHIVQPNMQYGNWTPSSPQTYSNSGHPSAHGPANDDTGPTPYPMASTFTQSPYLFPPSWTEQPKNNVEFQGMGSYLSANELLPQPSRLTQDAPQNIFQVNTGWPKIQSQGTYDVDKFGPGSNNANKIVLPVEKGKPFKFSLVNANPNGPPHTRITINFSGSKTPGSEIVPMPSKQELSTQKACFTTPCKSVLTREYRCSTPELNKLPAMLFDIEQKKVDVTGCAKPQHAKYTCCAIPRTNLMSHCYTTPCKSIMTLDLKCVDPQLSKYPKHQYSIEQVKQDEAACSNPIEAKYTCCAIPRS